MINIERKLIKVEEILLEFTEYLKENKKKTEILKELKKIKKMIKEINE